MKTVANLTPNVEHKKFSVVSSLQNQESLLLITDDCPLQILVELTGIEPVTPCLQSRCSPS
jgi:hypothetical protein